MAKWKSVREKRALHTDGYEAPTAEPRILKKNRGDVAMLHGPGALL